MSKESSRYKLRIMALTCAGVLALGYIVSIFVPVVMKMWTVSYGLISAGWSCTLLLIFYWFIDVLGFKKWTIFLVVIGVNALAVYLSDTVMRLSTITHVFTKDIAEFIGSFGPLFVALVYIGLEWVILYWLYKRKIFLTP
jgi:predicted acyltransferase